jgi:hypothetical protein
LQSKGLAGVMEDIRQATGGNVTTMSQLFTDIRALRGAMALTTDQGKLYTESLASQKAAHLGAGATADTLKVQLQSVAAQWQILQNRVHACDSVRRARRRQAPRLTCRPRLPGQPRRRGNQGVRPGVEEPR